jgi:transcriptional regulator with PAS, ATPase and Fis domain
VKLFEYFTDKYARLHGKTVRGILAPGKNQLLRHRWPGNVRELEECVEKAILASTDGWLRIDDHCCPSNFWLYSPNPEICASSA